MKSKNEKIAIIETMMALEVGRFLINFIFKYPYKIEKLRNCLGIIQPPKPQTG